MRHEPLILTVDVGTTGTKCCLFTIGGREVESATVPYQTSYPRPGWAEQDSDDYWRACVEGIRQILGSQPNAAEHIAVIGLCGQMNGCIPVDTRGYPTGKSIIHLDSRSSREREQILSFVSEQEFYRVTGNRPDVHLSLPKMIWFARNEPEAYARTAWFLQAKDLVGFHLTGILPVTDYSDASLTAGFAVHDRTWSTALLRESGIDPGKMPEVRPGVSPRGALSAEAARTLGLREGIPVATGCGDAAAATRGAGVRRATESYVCIGSSAWMSTLFESPFDDPGMRLQNFFDPDGVLCNACGSVQSAGICLDWVGSILGGEASGEPLGFAELEAAARAARAGSDGLLFLPLLMGERTPYWNPHTRGAFVGMTLRHGRRELCRSVFEGVAYALRSVLEVYREQRHEFASVTLLGGGLRSRFWAQIICDVFGVPCRLHRSPHNATGRGAAMVAAVAAGFIPSLEAWPADEVVGDTLHPGEESRAIYERGYSAYAQLYPQLKPVFDDVRSWS